MSSQMDPQEFYDRFSESYDATVNGPKVRAQNTLEAVRVFQKHHQDTNGRIFDTGCGTGLLKAALAGDFEYVGLDVSAKMLERAAERGYRTVHQPVEAFLSEISKPEYDFVFALSCLQFVRDIRACLDRIVEMAGQSVVLTIDDLSEEFLERSKMECYNHAGIVIPNATEDYFIDGWTSPTMGLPIRTRVVLIQK